MSTVSCHLPSNPGKNEFICRNPHLKSSSTIPSLCTTTDIPWIDLKTSSSELRPQFCMNNGQSFSWKAIVKSQFQLFETNGLSNSVNNLKKNIEEFCLASNSDHDDSTKALSPQKIDDRGSKRKNSQLQLSYRIQFSQSKQGENRPKRQRKATVRFGHEDVNETELNQKNKYKWETLKIATKVSHTESNLKNNQRSETVCAPRAITKKRLKNPKSDIKSVSDEWIGVLGNRVYMIKQTETTTLYKRLTSLFDSDNGNITDEQLLRNFFRLEVNLEELVKNWVQDEPLDLPRVTNVIQGIRLLRIDPIEAIFSFICSSNNNIPRITQLVDRLRQRFGKPLLITLDLNPQVNPTGRADISNFLAHCTLTSNGVRLSKEFNAAYGWFAFPSVDALASTTEEELRELGFGYRSKSLVIAAQQLQHLVAQFNAYQSSKLHIAIADRKNQPNLFSESRKGTVTCKNEKYDAECNLNMKKLKHEDEFKDYNDSQVLLPSDYSKYFDFLSQLKRVDCQLELMKLRGVGRKVADCIGALSLEQFDCIPIDTHLWSIASKRFDPKLQDSKSLNASIYTRAADLFRMRITWMKENPSVKMQKSGNASNMQQRMAHFMQSTVCFDAKRVATDERIKRSEAFRMQNDIKVSVGQRKRQQRIPSHVKHLDTKSLDGIPSMDKKGHMEPIGLSVHAVTIPAKVVFRTEQRASYRSKSLSRQETTASGEYSLPRRGDQNLSHPVMYRRSHSTSRTIDQRSFKRREERNNSIQQMVLNVPQQVGLQLTRKRTSVHRSFPKIATRQGQYNVNHDNNSTINTNVQALDDATLKIDSSSSKLEVVGSNDGEVGYYPPVWDVVFLTAERNKLCNRGGEIPIDDDNDVMALENLTNFNLTTQERRDTILTLSHSSSQSSVEDIHFTPFLQQNNSELNEIKNLPIMPRMTDSTYNVAVSDIHQERSSTPRKEVPLNHRTKLEPSRKETTDGLPFKRLPDTNLPDASHPPIQTSKRRGRCTKEKVLGIGDSNSNHEQISNRNVHSSKQATGKLRYPPKDWSKPVLCPRECSLKTLQSHPAVERSFERSRQPSSLASGSSIRSLSAYTSRNQNARSSLCQLPLTIPKEFHFETQKRSVIRASSHRINNKPHDSEGSKTSQQCFKNFQCRQKLAHGKTRKAEVKKDVDVIKMVKHNSRNQVDGQTVEHNLWFVSSEENHTSGLSSNQNSICSHRKENLLNQQSEEYKNLIGDESSGSFVLDSSQKDVNRFVSETLPTLLVEKVIGDDTVTDTSIMKAHYDHFNKNCLVELHNSDYEEAALEMDDVRNANNMNSSEHGKKTGQSWTLLCSSVIGTTANREIGPLSSSMQTVELSRESMDRNRKKGGIINNEEVSEAKEKSPFNGNTLNVQNSVGESLKTGQKFNQNQDSCSSIEVHNFIQSEFSHLLSENNKVEINQLCVKNFDKRGEEQPCSPAQSQHVVHQLGVSQLSNEPRKREEECDEIHQHRSYDPKPREAEQKESNEKERNGNEALILGPNDSETEGIYNEGFFVKGNPFFHSPITDDKNCLSQSQVLLEHFANLSDNSPPSTRLRSKSDSETDSPLLLQKCENREQDKKLRGNNVSKIVRPRPSRKSIKVKIESHRLVTTLLSPPLARQPLSQKGDLKLGWPFKENPAEALQSHRI